MSFSKFLLLVGAGATFIVAISVGLIAHWWFRESPVWLSSSSPNHTYAVDLTGDKGRGGFIIDSVVKYRLSKNGNVFVKDRVAHRGDWLDISFELAYPEHAWIRENVMRFWRKPDRLEEDRSDALLISSDASQAVRYLRIKTKDMFFIFDIKPRSTSRLSFTHQSEGNYFWCEGEFIDGRRFEYAANFLESKASDPLGYCIVIHDNRLTIESPHERGYDYRGTWDNLNIAQSPGCQP
jgi:hypothetical protein